MKNNKSYPYYDVKKITSIGNMMELAVKEAGDNPAFMYKGKDKNIVTVTYCEFEEDTRRLGTALGELGVLSSHVAVIGENSYKWILVYLTMLKSDGVFVPVDKELPTKDIINVLDNSDSEILFYSKRFEKIIPELAKALPNIKYFIGFECEEDESTSLSFDKLIKRGKELLEEGNDIYTALKSDVTSMRMIVYTSGTTGMSKGVMLSEDNLVSMVYYGLRLTRVGEKCLSVLPYHHTYEAVAGILVSLHSHSCICINEHMKAVLKNLQLYKPDYMFIVPAFAELFYKKIISTAKKNGKYKMLMKLMKISNMLRRIGIDLRGVLFKSIHENFGGNMKQLLSGGAPLRAELGGFFEDIGMDITVGYGITECSPLISANRNEFNDYTTVGVPVECLDVRFEDVTSDGDGEICVKGKTVMLGYYKNEEKTREVLNNGWFKTGDYGRMSEKGQIIITGRKKNIIVLENGKNVYPEELENYIMSVPYIAEVVVRGIKGETGGEIGLLAEVFPNEEEVKKLGEVDLLKRMKKDIAAVCESLPIYKHIGEIKICDKPFEKTTTNKIKR